MRLVCPNCEAKYEVPEDAIPETGRDVQCANCGHAWYQMRARAAVAEAVAAAPLVAPPVAKAAEPEPLAPEPEPEPEPVAAPEVAVTPESAPFEPEPEAMPEVAAPEPVAASAEMLVDPVPDPVAEAVVEPDPVVEPVAVMAEAEPLDAPVAADPASDAVTELDGTDDSLAEAPAALAAAPAAYAVDESVLAILREEAERESQARKADVGKPLEVQADLGIDSALPVKKKLVEVISTDTDVHALAEDADDKLAGRKTRLPDVEEINSTLRPSEQAMDGAGDAPLDVAGEGRSSFRSGFLLVMTLAIIAAALYISADALAEAVPPLAGVLKGYVSMIDGLRLQLDGLMQSATVAINGSGT